VRAAVFTGAGISGDAPASLPRGFGLRDDVLSVMHDAAREAVPSLVSDAQLDALRRGPYKLEVVLGRLWGTVGTDALRCLLALRLDLPNEAHLLCALHLLQGGTHVTLNFDVGIELAHDLLTGRAAVPADAPGEYRAALPAWQALVPPGPSPLEVVASHDAFATWVGRGRPPALLKIHGGLSADQRDLVDVVVVDIEELGQLLPARRAAIDVLGRFDHVLITGYSGSDPDVYEPLLASVRSGQADWCCYSLPASSPVAAEAAAHGITVKLGPPDGLAVTALRGLLGGSVPPWPSSGLPGEDYRRRFERWAGWLRGRHPADLIAQSWAWLLSDLGDLDAAEGILAHITRTRSDNAALLRHAEILYNRAKGTDRDRAAVLFRTVRDASPRDSETRYHCMLRLGGIARGNAIRHAHGPRVLADLAQAYGQPVRVLVATRGGRGHPEAGGDAYRALQQTSLRVLEQLAASSPRLFWPLLGLACRGVSVLGGRAERLVANGNRLALIRHHRMHLLALAALLRKRTPGGGLTTRVRSLRLTYENADDLPGAGNCTVTLAVLAAADRDPARARALLAEAREQYSAGRPDGLPLPSGAALLAVIARLLDRFGPGPVT
jgi:hypothetical protein